jgi:hypothetical protein
MLALRWLESCSPSWVSPRQITPGEENDGSTVLVCEGEQVDFSAGRLGNRFASVTCTVTDEALDAGAATVEFRLDFAPVRGLVAEVAHLSG